MLESLSGEVPLSAHQSGIPKRFESAFGNNPYSHHSRKSERDQTNYLRKAFLLPQPSLCPLGPPLSHYERIALLNSTYPATL